MPFPGPLSSRPSSSRPSSSRPSSSRPSSSRVRRRCRPSAATPALALTALVAGLLAGCGGGTAAAGGSPAAAQPSASPTHTGHHARASSTADPGTGSDASTGAGGGSGVDPCTLVTAADLTAVLGSAPAVIGPATRTADVATCRWGSSDTEYVKVEVAAGEEVYKVAAASSTQKVTGPWQKGAVFTAVTGGAIEYLAGGTSVAIQVFDLSDDRTVTVDELTTLATATAGRLAG